MHWRSLPSLLLIFSSDQFSFQIIDKKKKDHKVHVRPGITSTYNPAILIY